MSYILLTILTNSLIYVIFRLFTQYKIDTLQAIIINYLVCAIMGTLFSGFAHLKDLLPQIGPTIPYAISLGLLFFIVFNCIGKSTELFGMSVTSVADKLSFIIPVLFAFVAYKDPVNAYKIMGILLSLVAVVLAVFGQEQFDSTFNKNALIFPLIVFVGGGIISILIKEVQVRFPEINYNTFLIVLFGMATTIGMIYFLIQKNRTGQGFNSKNIIAGIVLGIPNYLSIYYLLLALDSGLASSVVFPIVNIGIVVISALIGVLFFKEKLSWINILGIIIAVIAISFFLIDGDNGSL